MSPQEQLVGFFLRRGCFREPNPTRQNEEKGTYKKGHEVRITAYNERELLIIRALLIQVGLDTLGKPYRKSARFIQPVYGQKAVNWFREAIAEANPSAVPT